MGRPLQPIPLSDFTGGVNRIEREAKAAEAVDALDVYAGDGEVRRRPALQTLGIAAPFYLPTGAMRVFEAYGPVSGPDDLVPHDISGWGASLRSLFIGCLEPFDGLEIEFQTPNTEPCALVLRYGPEVPDVGGLSAGAQAPGVFDTTRLVLDELFDFDLFTTGSFARDGQVSHRARIASLYSLDEWVPTDVKTYSGGFVGYWIKVSFVNAADEEVVLSAAANMSRLRIFQTQRVTGLLSTRIGNNPVAVVCSDRTDVRGVERGVTLGLLDLCREPTRPLLLVDYEGGGVLNGFEYPAWRERIPPGTDNAAVTVPDPPVDIGVDFALTRLDRPDLDPVFDTWVQARFSGGTLGVGLVPTTDGPGFIVFEDINGISDADVSDVARNRFEHCRLRCTANGSGTGVAIGSVFEVVSSVFNSTVTPGVYQSVLYLYPSPPVSTDSGNRFSLRKPSATLRTMHGDLEVNDSFANTVDWVFGRDFAAQGDGVGNGASRMVAYELSFDPRWLISSGRQWSLAYDTTFRRILMTNGRSGLMSYDGRRLRRYVADSTSLRAQQMAATTISTALANVAAAEAEAILQGEHKEGWDGKDPTFLPNSFLFEKPPNGRFVAIYRSRIVVANLPSSPNEVWWSEPGVYLDVWMKNNGTIVRTAAGDPIAGIAAILDRLVVWTPTAIFEGMTQGQPETILFRPAATAIGFVNNAAVTAIPHGSTQVLVGANTDGVYIYDGSDPKAVLDRWDRLIKGGVNTAGMRWSCAAAVYTQTLWFLAVPSAGSAVNNRIVVYDWTAKIWWVWTCPFGVSCMSREFDGRTERLLIGTEDGRVMTFTEAIRDDETAFQVGIPINGFAQSPALKPYGATEVAFESVQMEVAAMGSEGIELSTSVNRRRWSEGQIRPRGPGAVFGVGTFSALEGETLVGSRWTGIKYVLAKAGIPTVSKANEFQFGMSGLRRWAVRMVELLAKPKSGRK